MTRRFHLYSHSRILYAVTLLLIPCTLWPRATLASDREADGASPSGGVFLGELWQGNASAVLETVQGERVLFLGWDKELTGTDALGFSSLHDFLIAAGYEVEEDRIPTRPITLERLQQFDVVAFGGLPESTLSPTEAETFRAYVWEGGNLFLGGQWGDYDPEWQLNNNEIGAHFGVTFHQDLVCDPTNHLAYDGSCNTSPGDPDNGREYPLLGNVSSHPIGEGVTTLMLNWGQSLSGGSLVIGGDEDSWSDLGAELEPKPEDCFDSWFENEHDPGEPLGFPSALVAAEVQAGKMVAVGDVDFWWNFAFNWYGHRQLLSNIFEWFSTPAVCEYVPLAPDTPVSSESSEPMLYTFEALEPRWGAIGSTSGWGVGVYSGGQVDRECVTDLMAESQTPGLVNFVVGDFQRNDLGTYHARVDNLDAASGHRTEWDDGSGTLEAQVGGSPGRWGIPTTRSTSSDWVLDVYDVPLEADESYGFNLESDGEVQMLLFGGEGETYWAGRSGATWEAGTSRTYTAPVTGVYGLVLVNESAGAAGYSVLVRGSEPLPVAVSLRAEIEGSRPKVTWQLEGAVAEERVALWRWDTGPSDPLGHEGTGERLQWITDPNGQYIDWRARPETTYAYAIVDERGLDVTILVEASVAVPPATKAALGPVVPNPFNPSTQVYYEIPPASRVTIEVFDLAGRKLRVLLDGAIGQPAPFVPWDGTDAAGRRVASGVYFVRMTARLSDGGYVRENARVVLLK